MAITGATELSNVTTAGNAISAVAGPALVEAAIFMNLIMAKEVFPSDTNVIKFRKKDFLAAKSLAEATAYGTLDTTNDELTDTSVTVTAAKYAQVTQVSVEGQRFGAGQLSVSRLGMEHGQSHARAFDSVAKLLLDDFSNVVTSSAGMTVSDLLEGQFNIRAGKVPHGKLVAVLDHKAIYELKDEIASGTAPVLGLGMFADMLEKVPDPNGYAGDVMGISLFETSGLDTASSDDEGAIFDPRWALCAGIDQVNVMVIEEGSAGFVTEVASYNLFDIKEYYDEAGCTLRSDT